MVFGLPRALLRSRQGKPPGLRTLPTRGVGCLRPHIGQSFGVRGLSGRGVLRGSVEVEAGAV